MSDTAIDPIAEPVRELLTVFKEQLSTISFPDVSYSILEESTEKVINAASKLEEARKMVEAAEAEFSSGTEELQQKCAKALAYAKVYAEGNDALMEQLSAIQIGKGSRTAKRTSVEAPKEGSAPRPRQKKAAAVDQVEENG